MERLFISERVVLYLESNEQLGVFHDLQTGLKAYINTDAIRLIQHLIKGDTLNSFFLDKISAENKAEAISQSESVLNKLIDSGFLNRGSENRRGFVKNVSTIPPLRVIFLELTKKCNLRCGHCYACAENSHDGEMSSDKIFDLISQADDLGVMEIQLTGGEPFVLPYALKIIREIQFRLIPCSIFTNGTLITNDTFRYLSKNNYGLIFYISLDGFRTTHDAFRKSRGVFERTFKTIRKLIDLGCDVRINTAVGSHNITEMRRFVEFIRKEFGVLHRLVTVEPIGRAVAKMVISPKEFANLLQDTANTFEFLDSHDLNTDWSSPACGFSSSMLFVDSCGNVSFCPTLTQRENPDFLAGSIFDSSLKDIWETSLAFKKFRNSQCREVEKCRFRKLCKGGCRSRAYLSTGDINSPDLAMCLLYHTEEL